jgi:protein arginine N-methyltransferase 3
MKLVNFCRSNSTKKDFSSDLVISTYKDWSSNDEYLKPQLEDDPMLYAFEDDQSDDNESVMVDRLNFEDVQDLQNQLKQSNEHCKNLQAQLDSYKAMVAETYMSQSIKELVISKDEELDLKVGDADAGNYYFNSYAATEIHESMLRVRLSLIVGCGPY